VVQQNERVLGQRQEEEGKLQFLANSKTNDRWFLQNVQSRCADAVEGCKREMREQSGHFFFFERTGSGTP
jgi:hypothetical protein